MNLFGRRNRKPAPRKIVLTREIFPEFTDEPTVYVPMEAMDAVYDRSAGRFCEKCGVHGSHHTEKHNDFARAVLATLSLPIA